MRISTTLGALALGALAAAIPTAPTTAAAAPAKFAIQITATVDNKPISLYLAKGATGAGTEDLKAAAACSIGPAPQSQLLCDGRPIGASPVQEGALKGYLDMSPLAGATGADAITDGFAVAAPAAGEGAGGQMQLHWRSSKFATLPKIGAAIVRDQGGEAQWGLLASMKGQAPLLYAQLGCPGGTHDGAHTQLVVGSNKIVPL